MAHNVLHFVLHICFGCVSLSNEYTVPVSVARMNSIKFGRKHVFLDVLYSHLVRLSAASVPLVGCQDYALFQTNLCRTQGHCSYLPSHRAHS